MEVKALSNINGFLPHTPFHHTIKLMSYDDSYIVFVTKYNEVYLLEHNNVLSILNSLNEDEDSIEEIFNSTFNITHLACNSDNIILINENNELFLKGCFYNFKCNKTFELIDRMESLKFKKIKYLRLGSDFLFILTNDNKVYGFGNNYNALGINREIDSDTEENSETAIENDTEYEIHEWIEVPYKAKDISCSDRHSILLDLNGDIYTAGKNNCGQLGLGDKEHRKEFTKVQLNFKVIKLFADNGISFIVNEYNELFGCGYNEQGQLGIDNNYTNLTIFTKINFNYCQTKIFYYSNCDLTFITDENNNIYVTGEARMINKYLHSEKLNKFEKLNIFENKRKYIYLAIMFATVVFVLSDYKINNYEEEEENKLGLKCFTKILQNQLIDLNIYCKDTILKKRKRFEY